MPLWCAPAQAGASGRNGAAREPEVPAAGTTLAKGKEAAVVESVKAASDVYSPVSGTVTEGNAALENDPALVNTSPEADGWFFKLTIADEGELDGLMDEAAYKDFVASL